MSGFSSRIKPLFAYVYGVYGYLYRIVERYIMYLYLILPGVYPRK